MTSVDELELTLLLEGIHARYGYDFRGYERASIRRRVRTILTKTGVSHLGELLHRVLNDGSFFRTVLDDLTVQVSELFRDPAFYAAFRERVVPVLRTYPQLKVWHAGCATAWL